MKFNQETIATLGEQVTGSVKLASGTITTPLAFVDLELPGGYMSFCLEMQGVRLNTQDNLQFAFSQDGGTSFICDADNFDSYFSDIVSYRAPATLGGFDFTDSLFGTAAQFPTDPYATFCSMMIYPGNSTDLPMAHFSSFVSYIGASAPTTRATQICTAGVNLNATITPTFDRVNLIRALPYGNGDCNPPTSGETITAGSYILWGIKP